jgi:F-type H+-transporting ATPase subunit b
MPQLQQIDTYLSQVFWLLICFVALFLILRYVALPRMTAVLEARRQKIEGDLARAAALKNDAESTLTKYQASLAEGREKAQAVVRRAANEAQSRAAAAQESLQQKLATQIKAAEERIAQSRREALVGIEQAAGDLAQAAAAQLAGVSVDKEAAAGAVRASSRGQR